MKWISTTIKKKYMDKILSGEKKVEHKGDTPFWRKRLLAIINEIANGEDIGINFLCGKRCYKFEVIIVKLIIPKFIQKIDDGYYTSRFDIHLGDQITGVDKDGQERPNNN